MNRLTYETEPEPIEIEDDYDDADEEFELEDGYRWYEAEVTETVTKIVRVMAKDKDSAKAYLEECALSDIDMEKDIDEYNRKVAAVEETDPVDAEYRVPEWWYE